MAPMDRPHPLDIGTLSWWYSTHLMGKYLPVECALPCGIDICDGEYVFSSGAYAALITYSHSY